MAQPKVSSGANSGSEQSGPIYWSEAHKLAFERLSFAATSGSPMTVFVGREGTGRTRLVHELIAKNTSDCVIRMIKNPEGLSGEVFSDVLSTFDPRRAYSDDAEQNRNELFGMLQSLHAAERYPVLVVDDADQLSNLYIGDLCELCARSIDARPLLKLVFVGRPGMTDTLLGIRPDLMGPSFTMECMSKEDVRGFLQARLNKIGLSRQTLGKGAVTEAFALTSGIPARLNLICDGLKRYTTLKRFATKESTQEIDKAQMREIGALVRINELSQKADALRRTDNQGVGIAGLTNDAAKLEAENGVATPRGRATEDSGEVDASDQGVGRKTMIVAGAVVVLGTGALVLLLGSGAFFKDRLAGLQGEPAAQSEPAPQVAQPLPEPVAAPAPEPENQAEVEARIARIAAALAQTDPTATGQYLAALELSETAADAAAVAYARAALAGHARSAYYLGQIYETGEGVPVDLSLARVWYKAAGAEIDGAAERLRDLPDIPTAGVPSEPIQLYSRRMPDGAVNLVWTSGEGIDPTGFRVELSSAAGEVVKSIPLVKTSAIRVTAPDEAQSWRVIALDQTGETEVASPWIAIGP